MKRQPLVMFVLTTGLALLLTWAVAAQGAKVTADIQPASSVTSTDRAEFRSNQSTASLGYTSDITFTPAFTTYLPAVFKGYRACSTIPTLMSPANRSSLSTLIPLFRWDSGNDPNATLLRLQVAKDPDFTQVVHSLWWYGGGTGVREFRFPHNLDPATTYYWRAWLLCGETEGPYSEVWSFTTGSGGTILPAPTLVAPANGSAVPTTTVTLQWSPVSGAVEYLVHWRKVGETGYAYNWVAETQTTISWLSTNTTYEWWVSARNDYAIGSDSETWRFTTPAGSSSVSLQHPNRSFVEGSNTIVVFEGQDGE